MTASLRTDRLRLLDAYRGALTERQREALRLQLEEDWSVSELALSLGTSRAAAHDLLRRGSERLEELERQLGLCSRLAAAEAELAELRGRLRGRERGRASSTGRGGSA